MRVNFRGKTALITGASSGIGEATARTLAALNADVMLTARNEQRLQTLAAELSGEGVQVEILAGDIADEEFRRQLVETTVEKLGQLDILINAAGIITTHSLMETSLEEYDRIMDINLRSVFHLIQLAVPHLEQTKGTIVNVSSIAGVRSFPGIMAYCISKAALDQLTRCAALELANKGIRVNAVNPGVVITELHKRGGMGEEQYRQFLEHSRTTHPLGRVGTPREIADLIAFLASDAAGWITGITCSIDGGRVLTCAR